MPLAKNLRNKELGAFERILFEHGVDNTKKLWASTEAQLKIAADTAPDYKDLEDTAKNKQRFLCQYVKGKPVEKLKSVEKYCSSELKK